ncbi:MAG: DegT/DnrJ/EryC1/StrS family aminotransferase, partial [Fervidobacterium sp.]
CVILGNGTLGLMIALELFDFPMNAEIITTPFTFAATVSSIIWQKYKPVFVDIEKDTFNINPKEIEKKISEKTAAILPVHVFGNPCNVSEIDQIAKLYNLKVIYDAAHCFDVYYDGKSLYSFGDVSVASFHATKVFHTIEGGAIFTNNKELASKARKLRNFGFDEKSEIVDVGINAKMNEFQAIMGILNLDIVQDEILERKKRYEIYVNNLKDLPITFQRFDEKIVKYNYIYMPVLFESGKTREVVYENLKKNGYNTRKYFYPALNTVFSKEKLPIAEDISNRILHLPLYGELQIEEVEKICKIIRETIK